MKQTRPFSVTIHKKDKLDLENFALQDGFQRGIFFDTSGKARIEVVNSTTQYTYLFKTKTGKPKVWGEFKPSFAG